MHRLSSRNRNLGKRTLQTKDQYPQHHLVHKLKDLSVTKNLHFTIFCGLLGNEMANLLAKEAVALDQAKAPINQATAEALILRRVKNTYLIYELKEKASLKIHVMEKHPPDRRKGAGLSRKQRVIVSQLRTGGNSPIFNY
ncbi:hypothetical protein ElyMa_006190500 [Elysia marginata]|uniref:Uncharacterized protein n=1 Tax=Elysia marginata TaxID=1093978 RepID=A0AAV4H4R4_9GAST|nr:hypothetical protein ElyMa_006190500 [Elysia marginata]